MAAKEGKKAKRKQSEKKKLLRAGSRARAERAHQAQGLRQYKQHQHNLTLTLAGDLTPWEQAQIAREVRRAATCGKCRILFDEDGNCPRCGGSMNLKQAHEKRFASA